MNKKEMEEFLNKINAKKKEVKDLVDAGKLEEAKKAKAELIEMQYRCLTIKFCQFVYPLCDTFLKMILIHSFRIKTK